MTSVIVDSHRITKNIGVSVEALIKFKKSFNANLLKAGQIA